MVEVEQSTRAEPKGDYYPALDPLRLAAAFGVVWIHGGDTNPTTEELTVLAGFAVPCFFLMSLYLTLGSLERHHTTFAAHCKSRFARLAPAYAAWSAIYLLLRFAKHYVNGQHFDVDWASVVLAGGASVQLWFVPVLLVLGVLMYPLYRVAEKMKKRFSMGVLLIAGALAALLLADALDRAFPADRSWANFGIRYALRSLPAAFFAAGLWCLLSGGGKPITSPRGSLLVAGCAMAAFGAAAYPTTWFAYLAAIGLFLIGVSWSGGAWGLLSTFGALAYGIYLSHAMFVEGFQFLAARMHYETGLGLTLLNITASFCLSGVLTWFLLRFRQTRFLVS